MNRDVCEHFNPVDLPCDKCKREAMNRDDIIRMAREAGLTHMPGWVESGWGYDNLERFAALVAAAERDKYEAKFKQLEAIMQAREQQPNKPCCLAEREACAKVCEKFDDGAPYNPADDCAAAIRARGQQ